MLIPHLKTLFFIVFVLQLAKAGKLKNKSSKTPQHCPRTGVNGEYRIKPAHSTIAAFRVYCEYDPKVVEDGGWIVIARFVDGNQLGHKLTTCAAIRDGYGSLQGEFWLGLEKMHQISRSGNYELVVSFEFADGSSDVLEYKKFYVASEYEKYAQSWGSFAGEPDDADFAEVSKIADGVSEFFCSLRFDPAHPNARKNSHQQPSITIMNQDVLTSCPEEDYEEGVYIIKPTNSIIAPFPVYCEGGSIVIARRSSKQLEVELNSNCSFLQHGHGSLQGDFWLGLEKMHQISRSGKYQLELDYHLKNGDGSVFTYDGFRVDSEYQKYQQNWGYENGSKKKSLKALFESLRFHPEQSENCYSQDSEDERSSGKKGLSVPGYVKQYKLLIRPMESSEER